MNKTTLQISSVIGLAILILMAGISAEAQNQYRAYIPFNFTIDQKSYEAGNYVIEANSATNAIVVRDAKASRSHIIMITRRQDYSKVTGATLVFDLYDSQYSLSVIRTPSFAMRLSKSRTKEALARRNRAVQQKIVALTTK